MNAAAIRELARAALSEGVRVRRDFEAKHLERVVRACELVVSAFEAGNKVLLCGNGGSASDAQHIAAEFVGRYVREREPLPALALHTDTSALTAIANDYGFEQVFARQVRALGKKGDVLVAITTSGKSPNIMRAVEAAREVGMLVIGLTGQKGQAFADAVDVGIAVPTTVTARIQELHITVGHILCEAVDAARDRTVAPSTTGQPVRVTASPKERTREELAVLRAQLTLDKKTLVWTSGVFDVLHAGHLESLRAARALGDVLLVGVNDDASVKRYKGENRPIFSLAERLEMLSALELVDFVTPFSEDTPAEALAVVQPHVFCKGADYAPINSMPGAQGKPVAETSVVTGYGGRIAFLPLVAGRSSTDTLRRLGMP